MNQEIKKVVNIYPTMPVTRVTPPLRTVAKNVSRPISYIRSCIMGKAMVDEVLPDGTTVRLGLHNYDKNNCVAKIEEPIEVTVVVEEPVEATVEEAPVVEAEDVVEAPVAEKSDWDIAYENALAGKDLESMTKKQRKEAKAEARAIADAVVANNSVVEEPVEATVEEAPVVEAEEVVVTADAEDLSEVTE